MSIVSTSGGAVGGVAGDQRGRRAPSEANRPDVSHSDDRRRCRAQSVEQRAGQHRPGRGVDRRRRQRQRRNDGAAFRVHHLRARQHAAGRQSSGPVRRHTMSFNLAPGASLSDAVTAVADAMNRIGVPATIHGNFQGTAQAFQQSIANEPYLIAAALIAVYIVLGILYESYIHPITILSTLPSAGVGAVLALLVFRTEFSIIALIGVILLIGIVKKNAILMIDFALDAERQRGLSSREAIYQACLLRFRPIMMTTMAAMLGAIPLATASAKARSCAGRSASRSSAG